MTGTVKEGFLMRPLLQEGFYRLHFLLDDKNIDKVVVKKRLKVANEI
jgi:hypothetical protein